MHKKANAAEREACHPWLESEVEAVGPKLILCLGATAAQSVLRKPVPITKERGKLMSTSPLGVPVLLTWHPSAILRTPDREAREQKRQEFKSDLRKAWKQISKS